MKHEAGKGDEMQSRHGFRHLLLVSGEPSEAGCPGEGSLDHPAPGQQHEALLRLRQPDDGDFNPPASAISAVGPRLA